jgi:hypothetical protein
VLKFEDKNIKCLIILDVRLLGYTSSFCCLYKIGNLLFQFPFIGMVLHMFGKQSKLCFLISDYVAAVGNCCDYMGSSLDLPLWVVGVDWR